MLYQAFLMRGQLTKEVERSGRKPRLMGLSNSPGKTEEVQMVPVLPSSAQNEGYLLCDGLSLPRESCRAYDFRDLKHPLDGICDHRREPLLLTNPLLA